MTGVLQAIGDKIGERYIVRQYVGQGGMQEVYAVQDLLLNRTVALKVPKNPSAEKRFKRSAVLSAKVNHDNVAKTLDYVEDADRFYLVEEYIDGCDLGRFMQQYVKMLDPFSSARVLHHLAKGLAASHHAGVVHRDLKPTNVMVVGAQRFEGFKITDFGIAKMAAEEIGEAVSGGNEEGLTSSQTALGALPYMAPETIDDMKTAGKPADVWAIGAMGYELLTGNRPFGTGYKAVPAIQAANVPQLPHTTTMNSQFAPYVKAMYEIIKKCLVKDPKDRLTADDLVIQCQSLYYSVLPRKFGTVKSLEYNSYGFLSVAGGHDVMYHIKSLYGTPSVSVGDRVWFTPHPGEPRSRAFPLVKAM